MKRNVIRAAYVRHYSDNGQTTAYVDWMDGSTTCAKAPKAGTPCPCCGEKHADQWNGYHLGTRMTALFARAEREGIKIEIQKW